MKDHITLVEPAPWEEEELLTNGDAFFSSLEQGIGNAQISIELEMYIFENDVIGERIVQALIAAHKRGVSVRVVVDGVGSKGWVYSLGRSLDKAKISRKVFHQLPWERLLSKEPTFDSEPTWASLYERLNSRDHRKVCIVDGSTAWVGSLNISSAHSKSLYGDLAWRDLAIRVQGDAVRHLVSAFNLIWYPRRPKYRRERRLARYLVKQSEATSVRLNATRYLRHRNYQRMLLRFDSAKERIWITNAYFVPSGSLLTALTNAASRGVDVKILTPSVSDVFFMPWVAAAFHTALLGAGVQVFEFLPSILHAKSMIIDNCAIVGTSNLNDRSLIHDLEVDILTNSSSTVTSLISEYTQDLTHSRRLTLETCQRYTWFHKLLGHSALLFRHWI